jgi:hypothetical protein
MPYIPPERREFLESATDAEIAEVELSVGDLNYAITGLLDEWIGQEGLSYQAINSAIGVLECAKLELYRRVAAPYEDNKIEQNGDVYSCNLNT